MIQCEAAFWEANRSCKRSSPTICDLAGPWDTIFVCLLVFKHSRFLRLGYVTFVGNPGSLPYFLLLSPGYVNLKLVDLYLDIAKTYTTFNTKAIRYLGS